MADDFDVAALGARAAAGEALQFVFFWGHKPKKGAGGGGPWLLSQWYPAPFTIGVDRYATAEHFMMAQKAQLFGDEETRREILAAGEPGAVKALGRRVKGFDAALWHTRREAIVTQGSIEKFRQNPLLLQYLETTGDAVLVEASPTDAIWGIGLKADDPAARDPRRWPGLNLLGSCLMRARAALRAAPASGPGAAGSGAG